jgi:hypothetical protein
MNLFRSEEHARNWSAFDPLLEKGIKPLSFWNDIFSSLIFRSRGRSDYLSWLRTDQGKKAWETVLSKINQD